MEAFLVSTGLVALAEIGDKTQLLSFMLAARYKRPWPICWGILVATAANHAMASAVGAWVADLVAPTTLRWILAASFVAMAVWMLIPDRLDNDTQPSAGQLGVFGATTLAFFLAEMGDKTQIATVAMAARFDAFLPVVLGTTFGMMIANVPAVLLGDRIAHRLPVRAIHATAAAIFVALAIAAVVTG
jgi:putative Ca2+/H+ antiporter (TMEM165/GDT1 family)